MARPVTAYDSAFENKAVLVWFFLSAIDIMLTVLFATSYELRIPSAARIPLAQAAVMPLLVPAPSPTR